ncbi:MAG: hypothetical protein MZW92_62600 [Comamonadaceae bacterium]|nr:hypothetical protein [Comamonadaceae bacterium]
MLSLGQRDAGRLRQGRRRRRSRCSACPGGRARAVPLPELCLGRLHGAAGRADPASSAGGAAAAGPDLRDRHGRGPEGHGARRPRPGLPAGAVRCARN